MRLFNSEQIKQATGDVFGRIYEYFLAKFSIQKAHDNGEFFTPSSLVQMIVNVIEPDHGTVFDPACGSGGMFVQSSHFIEHEGGDTAKKVVFYGQEKNRDTIRIAKMNLAVHGLEGKIAEAITYYQDEHKLVGESGSTSSWPIRPSTSTWSTPNAIKSRPAPALRPAGRQQAEESLQRQLHLDLLLLELPEREGPRRVRHVVAGIQRRARREDVRQKIVETGDVDVMISIRSNFFYTRTVPCELWFFDRGKPEGPAGQGADDRRPQRLPQGQPHDQRFLARADGQPLGHRLAVSRAARALLRSGRAVFQDRGRRDDAIVASHRRVRGDAGQGARAV